MNKESSLTLEDIRKLIDMFLEAKLENLSFAGLSLSKSKYEQKQIVEESKSEALQPPSNLPSFMRGKEHLMYASPFKEPLSNSENE